jgi:hypothetical protein
MSRKDDPGSVWLPLDRETRERLMARARDERRNPLELAAELLAAKLAAEDRSTHTTH